MRKPRVYVDTSVFGGVNDEEFAAASGRFFERVAAGDFIVLVSSETIREIMSAPEEVARVLKGMPRPHLEDVPVDEEVLALAEAYVVAGVLGPASMSDATHVAAATVAGADLVLSWNFKHIVRYDRIRKFNGVNALKGYLPLDIRSPLEVDYGEEDQDV